MSLPRGALALVLSLAAVAPAAAQGDLETARDELRRSLSRVHFASFFDSLVLLSEELELSGARYDIDDDFDTELSTLGFPFHQSLRPWGEDATGVYLEGALGCVLASERVADLYAGALPGAETSVETESRTIGGLIGVGPELRLREGLRFAPLVNVGLAHIRNDANFAGPGADATAQLVDGIAFNWDGLLATGGGAARLDWVRPAGERHTLEWISRYDVRWSKTLETDDVAQEFSTRSQLLTLRADLSGPTGWALRGHAVDFRAFAGYRRFLEGALYDARDIFQLGGGLTLVHERLPLGRGVTLNFAGVVGQDLVGWTLGMSLAF